MMSTSTRLVGAYRVIGAILIGASLVGCAAASSSVANTPGPVALASSSPGASPSVNPTTPPPMYDFGDATALLGGTHRKFETASGVTYYTDFFAAPFTIRPGAGWWVENNINALTSFERGPNSPEGAPEYIVQFVMPTKVVPPGNSALIPAPADLLGWLATRPDLTLSAPTSITVAGVQGRMVEGGLRAGAALNPEGLVNLICGQLSECGYEGGQLIGIAPGWLIEFVSLEVRGTPVVIALGGPAAHSSTTQRTIDAFLKTFEFTPPEPVVP
jgi:hypothetical protein